MELAYLFDPVKQFVSRNGIPLAGGFLNVFIGESQEPADTFSDAAGTTLNPEKIPVDSAGRALGVFVDSSRIYTLKAYNTGGQLQFSIYPVSPGKGGGGSGDSYYYPGDDYIYIDQDAREISLHNTKAIRGDEKTIQMIDTTDAVILQVNPDIVGDETVVAAGKHTSVDYDSANNTYTVNAEYAGSDTVEIDSDGAIKGKYEGGYGIAVDGNTIRKTHHQLVGTENAAYSYCKVFEFTWNHGYGQGLCVFTATHYSGAYVTFAVSHSREKGVERTVAWPNVVLASPGILYNGFIERLEIRESGDRLMGYLKLRNFTKSQFWLDWEGRSEVGSLLFDPQLTNSPEGSIAWVKAATAEDVFYNRTDTDLLFQKKLVAGYNIIIDEDNVISATADYDGKVFIATYGTTAFADIKSAISKGEYVVVKGAGGAVYYTLSNNLSARIVFMGKTSLTVSADQFVEVDSDNNWTQTDATLPKVSFTAHGSVTTTDNYNDVGNTAGFAIGQKGTHGGLLDIGAKTGSSGWVGSYKSLTRIYHNSTSESAPTSGSATLGTVTLGTDYASIGSVSQYLLAAGVQWTCVIELAQSASPGRGMRLTVSGIGSSDITWMTEEIR